MRGLRPIGPRGDAYAPSSLMSAGEAQAYHSAQLETLADTPVDLVTALTTDLNGTTDAQLVFAEGPYNATTGVLSADQLIVLLNN